jgi:hypothetical protein
MPQNDTKMLRVLKVAEANGGLCLSKSYLGVDHRYLWQCGDCGKKWRARFDHVRRGSWCPRCKKAEGVKKRLKAQKSQFDKKLDNFKRAAQRLGGDCLSKQYKNNYTKLKFICSEGHIWESLPGSILKGSWCKQCQRDNEAMKYLTIARNAANKKGGECLSVRYLSNEKKLSWKCQYGHTWKSSFSSVVSQGTWCPKCGIEERAKKLRYSINHVRKIVESKGGKLLSQRYESRNTRVKVQCENGHKWEPTAGAIFNGSWCTDCRKKTAIQRKNYKKARNAVSSSKSNSMLLEKIKSVKKTVKRNGGRLLTKQIFNLSMKIKCQCKENHIFELTPLNIEKGHWCKECHLNSKRLGIERMHEYAKSRGGTCLSHHYKNNSTPLSWLCGDCGNQWKAPGSIVTRKSWCPKCGRKVSAKKQQGYTIKDAHSVAKSKGGKCLSDEYVKSTAPLLWECSEGHQWSASFDSVNRIDTWCDKCARKKQSERQKDSIEKYQKIAEERGGKLMSAEYVKHNVALEWECQAGHRWNARPDHVKYGSWCPECNIYYGEEIVRCFFEGVLGLKFPKTNPDFLKGEKNIRELDGYNQQLRLAFEHQGSQHYEPHKKFHKTVEDFLKQLERDQAKRKACAKAEVRLVEVPEVPGLLSLDELPIFLEDQFKYLGLTIKKPFSSIDINIAYKQDPIDELKKIAKARGGKLVSSSYLGAAVKLKWQCGACGNEWEATPSNIKGYRSKKGTWCPKCRSRR